MVIMAISSNEVQKNNFDALIPGEMAQKAEEVGAKKASLDFLSTFALAVLAGVFYRPRSCFCYYLLDDNR